MANAYKEASKTILINWKCSECGTENSEIRTLKGAGPNLQAAKEKLESNYRILLDLSNPKRYKCLYINYRCACAKCGWVEAWNGICDQHADQEAADAALSTTIGTRGVLGGSIVGIGHGIHKLSRVGDIISLERQLKKLKPENHPTIIEGTYSDSDRVSEEDVANIEDIFASIDAWGTGNEKTPTITPDEMAWDNMVRMLCTKHPDWEQEQYLNYLDNQKAENVIDDYQYECLIEELNDAFSENRPVNFRQFFYEN